MYGMMKRHEIQVLLKAGLPQAEVARLAGVSRRTVQRIQDEPAIASVDDEAERGRRFGKGYVEPRPRGFLEETPLETTWEEVLEAALAVELTHPSERAHRVTTGFVALEEKIQLILDTLGEVSKIEFSKLLEPWNNRIHGVMTLLAGLELSKQRAVTLRQARLFSELWILRRDLEAWVGEVSSEEVDSDMEGEEWAPGIREATRQEAAGVSLDSSGDAELPDRDDKEREDGV